MVKVKVGDRELYLDGFLKSNLDIIKEKIKQDWDFVFTVDGREGAGKSAFGQQLAYYLDPTFDIKRIAFNPEQFKKVIYKAKKYQAVIFDEAFSGLASAQSQSKINFQLVSMMAEIRQKNLFVFVILPSFWTLQKYIAIWRSCALLHCYCGENFQRGFFAFYNYSKKKELYIKGQKHYQYFVKPNFRGRFTKGYTVPEKKYRKLKLDAMGNPDAFASGNKFMIQRDSLIMVLNELGYKNSWIEEAVKKYSSADLSVRTIQNIITKMNEVKNAD